MYDGSIEAMTQIRKFISVSLFINLSVGLYLFPFSVYAGKNSVEQIEEIAYGAKIKIDSTSFPKRMNTMSSNNLPYSGERFSLMKEAFVPLDSAFRFITYRTLYSITLNMKNEVDELITDLDLKKLNDLLKLRIAEFASYKLKPIDKVIEQRMYWDMFDAIYVISDEFLSKHNEIKPNSAKSVIDSNQRYITAVLNNLSNLIYKLRLSSNDINKVNSLKSISKYIDQYTWMKDVSHKSRVSVHSNVGGNRSYVEVYISIDGGSEKRDLIGKWEKQARLSIAKKVDTPKPPVGSVFILLRKMLIFNDKNEIVALPIVEEIAGRKVVGDSSNDLSEVYWLSTLNSRESRKSNSLIYFEHGLEDITWGGMLIGVADPFMTGGLAELTTVKRNCESCHALHSPGVGDLIVMHMSESNPKHADNIISNQADLTIKHKKQSSEFRALMGMINGIDG